MAQDKTKLKDRIKANQGSINSVRDTIYQNEEADRVQFFVLQELLEEQRAGFERAGNKLSNAGKEVEKSLDDIIKKSKDAKLSELRFEKQRLEQLEELYNQQSKSLTDDEKKRLSGQIAETKTTLNQSEKKKSGVLGLAKGLFSDRAIDIGSVLIGAAGDSIIGAFMANILGKGVKSYFDNKRDKKSKLIQDQSNILGGLKDDRELLLKGEKPISQKIKRASSMMSPEGDSAGVGPGSNIEYLLLETATNVESIQSDIENINKNIERLVRLTEDDFSEKQDATLDTAEATSEQKKAKDFLGIREKVGNIKDKAKSIWADMADNAIWDVVKVLLAGSGITAIATSVLTALGTMGAGVAAAVGAAMPILLASAAIGGIVYSIWKLNEKYFAPWFQDKVKDLAQAGTRKGAGVLTSIGRAKEKYLGSGDELDYYRKLLKQDFTGEMGPELRTKAEMEVLDLMKEQLEEKKRLKKEVYIDDGDGSIYGNMQYKDKDGNSMTIDEATEDINNLERTTQEYEKYLEIKKSKGATGLKTENIRGNDGIVYQNPLFAGNSEQRRTARIDKKMQRMKNRGQEIKTGTNEYGIEKSDNTREVLSRKDRMRERIEKREKIQERRSRQAQEGQPVKIPNTGVDINTKSEGNIEDELYKAIATPETGSVDKLPLDDPRRFIRTKAGSNSSAYGPVQITRNLMKGYIKGAGAEDLTPEEMEFAERFIEQGSTFLNSSYSDSKYGAGGEGDLNTPEDRAMYEKVAKKLMLSEYNRVGGDQDAFIRAWRGVSEGEDPQYYAKVRAGLGEQKSDNMQVAKLNKPDLPVQHNQLGFMTSKNKELKIQAQNPTPNVSVTNVNQGGGGGAPSPKQGMAGPVNTRQDEPTLVNMLIKGTNRSTIV